MSSYGLHDQGQDYRQPQQSYTYSGPPTQHAASEPVLSIDEYQPRTTYEEVQPQYDDPATRTPPRILSHLPASGPAGTKLYVEFQASYSMRSPTAPHSFSVIFGSMQVPALVTTGTENFRYTICADVPAHAMTGVSASSVTIWLGMADSYSRSLPPVEIGVFTFVDAAPVYATGSLAIKRKSSPDESDFRQSPAKRAAPEQREEYPFSMPASSGPMYSLVPTTAAPTYYSSEGYDLAGPSRSYQYVSSPASQPGVRQTAYAQYKVPHSPASASPHPLALINNGNPPLQRTSTLPQPPAGMDGRPSPTGAFNPYAIYPTKAVLALDAELDTMAKNWTRQELDSRRRIVRFWREQKGSTVRARFAPTMPEDLPDGAICVSCIWWEERRQCFITSVDTIALLERLIGVAFGVEEKNRIRRNLEGFKPLTVSKTKDDSQEFFKVIMGFPNPKPRNIEKDVKVFTWDILEHALKKIVGKYSASWASTTEMLETPENSTYQVGLAMTSRSDVESLDASSNRSPSVIDPASHIASISPVINTPGSMSRMHDMSRPVQLDSMSRSMSAMHQTERDVSWSLPQAPLAMPSVAMPSAPVAMPAMPPQMPTAALPQSVAQTWPAYQMAAPQMSAPQLSASSHPDMLRYRVDDTPELPQQSYNKPAGQ